MNRRDLLLLLGLSTLAGATGCGRWSASSRPALGVRESIAISSSTKTWG